MEFDISAYEAADTARLELLGIDGDPFLYEGKQVTLVMFGPGSKEQVAAQAKVDSANNARLYQAVRGGNVKNGAEDARREQIQKLVACTHSVENFPLTAAQIFANPKLGYLNEQAAKFMGEWRNFPPGSTKA